MNVLIDNAISQRIILLKSLIAYQAIATARMHIGVKFEVKKKRKT